MNVADLSYCNENKDDNWGAIFSEVASTPGLENVFVGHVKISDLEKIATEMSAKVIDTNWIMSLDNRAKRSYETTVINTARVLVEHFKNKLSDDDKVASEFGEFMVSMSSSRALELLFKHRTIPIAELWKPKVLGNEGFDFHTICTESLINFGEAKFSTTDSPYSGNSGDSSGAGGQADGFIGNGKHLMDGVHLTHLAGEEASSKLDKDLFGVVLAFSLNAKKPFTVFKNAIDAAKEYQHLKKAKNIYIIGVSHAIEN